MNKLEWQQFKGLINSKFLPIQMEESEVCYRLYSFDGPLQYRCDIIKETPTTSSQLEFETIYKPTVNKSIIPRDSTSNPISKSAAFSDTGGFRFRGCSFKGTAVAGQTSDIDLKLVEERYVNGGRLIINSPGDEDQMTFQVIDKDNVFGYGAGTVLDQFITDFYIPSTGNLEVALAYPARLYAGLWLRIKYKNTSTQDLVIKCNLYLHKKT